MVPPTGKVVNPSRDTNMDCRKDLHGIFLYFNKQSFSVLDQKKIATQLAVESEFKKRSFFVQTINDATCSNRIIHYLNKETRRV
jgi:REP element-mobilizing transposase RayT